MPAPVVNSMPGREVMALAIQAFDDRAAFGVATVEAYGGANVAPGLNRNIELDSAVANILRALTSKGATKLEDLPRDKEGKPSFVAKVRWETTNEIVQMVAGALRGAFAKVPFETGVDDAA